MIVLRSRKVNTIVTFLHLIWPRKILYKLWTEFLTKSNCGQIMNRQNLLSWWQVLNVIKNKRWIKSKLINSKLRMVLKTTLKRQLKLAKILLNYLISTSLFKFYKTNRVLNQVSKQTRDWRIGSVALLEQCFVLHVPTPWCLWLLNKCQVWKRYFTCQQERFYLVFSCKFINQSKDVAIH